MQGPIKETLERAQPASRIEGRIAVGTMASGAEISIPWVALKGKNPGACLWINGQVHGAEINGVLAALDFINSLAPSELSGNVVVTASANPLALDGRSKATPQDDNDLDQSFPGRAGGFTTDRLAHALFAQVRDCASLLINMHTMGPMFESKPYAVYKQHPNGKVTERTLLQYIAPFQPNVACRMNIEAGRGELPGNIGGAIDYQLISIGIPAFMIELGGGGRAETTYIAQGMNAFVEVARMLGILSGQAQRQRSIRRATRRAHVMVTHGGLYRTKRSPGDMGRAGEAFGQVMDLYGRTIETVTLPYDHIIIGTRRDPTVHSGDRAGFVAQEWDEVTLY
jgi:hypothetical protein